MNHDLPGPPGYCSSQLIPYLGNKRSLLPRLHPVLARLAEGFEEPRFMDPFAGSGAVSRLARAMGMRVFSNDWEPYSQAINSCWLGLCPEDISMAFGSRAGLDEFLDDWNVMHPLDKTGRVPESARSEPYIARWYAPSMTAEPRLGEERLFYTAENAVFVDRVRTRIENEYPDPKPGTSDGIRRCVLMGTLLLEAAVHTNTSGVFKAYHNGFGGHGKDALSRILGRMVLEAPILPSMQRALTSGVDAAVFMQTSSADIAYFDPPYNQHQYGSNYHMLNTILRWDGRPVPMDSSPRHGFSAKAGIPESWKATRSDFCVKSKARSAIEAVLNSCDAAVLVFSWSADGHLHAEELINILEQRGRVEIVALDYVSYRGGRQSASRNPNSQEYLFLVDTRNVTNKPAHATKRLGELVAADAALRSTYDPEKVRTVFFRKTSSGMRMENQASLFFNPELRRPSSMAHDVIDGLSPHDRTRFLEMLSSCACRDVVDELSVLIVMAQELLQTGKRTRAVQVLREVPRLMRKLAHDKYSIQFQEILGKFRNSCEAVDDKRLADEISNLERLMALRTCH